MPNDVYSADQIVNKTLIAKKKLNLYRDAVDGAVPFGSVAAGQPVGVVYSYLAANPSLNRSGLWWMFYDAGSAGGKPYYLPHQVNDFDISALRQQGVITVAEQIEQDKENELNNTLPWYDNLVRKYGVWVVVAILGSAAIRGVLSKK